MSNSLFGADTASGRINPALYINRELSWLAFNRRVLEEAEDPRNPLLERVKFAAIYHSNLDEFFMVRVSAFKEWLATGDTRRTPNGFTPAEQLAAIRQHLLEPHGDSPFNAQRMLIAAQSSDR